MIEHDTVRLLRECDAGIKMGIASVDEVIDKVNITALRQKLVDYKQAHEKLKERLQKLLTEYNDEGKDPPGMVKGMAWLKTNLMTAVKEDDDATVADLMVDGCNMGVKSLSKYLNQYAAADEKSKNITKDLISLEEKMSVDMRPFL